MEWRLKKTTNQIIKPATKSPINKPTHKNGLGGTKWILKVFPGIRVPRGDREGSGRTACWNLCIHACSMAGADIHNA